MPDQILSILVGTSGLTVAAALALALAVTRGVPRGSVPSVVRLTLLAVLVHGGHFVEEAVTGFHVRFPALLGLTAWPFSFFVTFNLVWIVIWLVCAGALRRFPKAAGFPVWFLAIASAANGVVHPVLALAVGGYFPGLWTSPLAGVVGLVLLRALASRPAVSP